MSENAEPQNTETPYLTAALICERVIHEKDGVMSLMRLVDTVNMNILGAKDETELDTLPAIATNLTMFMSFRAGPARGKREVFLLLYDPTGTRKFRSGPYPMVFTLEEQGHYLNIRLNLALKDTGLYWFEVEMAERILSRIPMMVNQIIQQPGQTELLPETPKSAE